MGTSSTISPLPCEETKLEANRRRKLENDKKMQQDREKREMRLQRKTASISAKSDPVAVKSRSYANDQSGREQELDIEAAVEAIEIACMKNNSASPPACCPGCGKGLSLGEECCVVIQEEEYRHVDHSSDEESDGDVDEYGGDFLGDAHRYPLNVSHLAAAVDDSAGNTTTQSEAVEGTSTYTSFFVNIRPF